MNSQCTAHYPKQKMSILTEEDSTWLHDLTKKTYPFRLQLTYTQPNGQRWSALSRLLPSITDCQNDIYENCNEDVVKNKDGQLWVILEGPPELWK